MLSGFFVVFLVETADELFKDIAHAVIVETRMFDATAAVVHGVRAEVDIRGDEFLDEMPQHIRRIEPLELVSKVEFLDDLLHVGAEAVQVIGEVGAQLFGVVQQAAEGEFGGIVKRLPGDVAEGLFLMGDPGLVEQLLLLQHLLLARLQETIQSPDDGHRQDHVPVFPPHIDIPEHIIGDTPDEIDDSVVQGPVHRRLLPSPNARGYCCGPNAARLPGRLDRAQTTAKSSGEQAGFRDALGLVGRQGEPSPLKGSGNRPNNQGIGDYLKTGSHRHPGGSRGPETIPNPGFQFSPESSMQGVAPRWMKVLFS